MLIHGTFYALEGLIEFVLIIANIGEHALGLLLSHNKTLCIFSHLNDLTLCGPDFVLPAP